MKINTDYIVIKNPISNFLEKIESYSEIQEGWYFGSGVRPNLTTIENALDIASFAYNNFFDVDSVAGISGEIQILIGRKSVQQYLEITFETDDKTFNITKYKNRSGEWDIVFDEDFDHLTEIKAFIEKFSSELHEIQCPNSSEYSPSDISRPFMIDMPAPPSETITAEYQLLELAA